jgi:uncharacterized Zn finger protein (UPF0148 family)
MPDEQKPIQPFDQPPPLPRAANVRPERSRMIPPLTESEEWQSILDDSRKRRNRKGALRHTDTADGATLVERADSHANATIQTSAAELLPQPSQLPLPCPACGSPRSPGAKFCVACGMPFEATATVPPEAPAATTQATRELSQPPKEAGQISTTSFHCQNCGSDIAVTTGERSIRCPFCDSTYVAEIQSDRTGRRRPEFVIGFAVTREQALQKYFEWIRKGGWFRPGDLSLRAISDKQVGVYVPFWHYAYEARSRWGAMIGQHWYRTETYTVRTQDGKTETRTRTVQETEWSPLSGKHHKYYFGYLVSASKGLSQQEALSIQPYDLRAITRFKPYYLAGWTSEEYSVDYAQAKAIAESEFQQREINNISRMMPGDTYGQLNVQTEFELNETDLMLLPVHILSYRYRDRVYRFLVNGQTGRIAGEKPWSGVRIAGAVSVVVILILLAVFVIWYLQNR